MLGVPQTCRGETSTSAPHCKNDRQDDWWRINLLPSNDEVEPTFGASSIHRLLAVATVHVLTRLVASHGSHASTQHRVTVPTADLAADAAHELNDAAAGTHQHKDRDYERDQHAAAAALSRGALAVSARLHPLLIATLLLEAPLLEATLLLIAALQHDDIAPH